MNARPRKRGSSTPTIHLKLMNMPSRSQGPQRATNPAMLVDSSPFRKLEVQGPRGPRSLDPAGVIGPYQEQWGHWRPRRKGAHPRQARH